MLRFLKNKKEEIQKQETEINILDSLRKYLPNPDCSAEEFIQYIKESLELRKLLEKLRIYLPDPNCSPKEFAECMELALKFKDLLVQLESSLHDTDSPEEIAMGALKAACEYYQADWCGVLDVDLELRIWSPIWWYYEKETDQTLRYFHEFEVADSLKRWGHALKTGSAMIIPNVEDIKEIYPDEYKLYRRLHANSAIGVPFWKRPTGYLVVRNPQMHVDDPSLLRMLAYVIIAQINERKLMDSVNKGLAVNPHKKDTDVFISLFGNMRISVYNRTLDEADFTPKVSALIVYLLLQRKEISPPWEIIEALWADEKLKTDNKSDSDNRYNSLRVNVHKARQTFLGISKYKLIETTSAGYRFNPELNIVTDLQMFENHWKASQKTPSTIEKVSLLKEAFDLYKGSVFEYAKGEHWLYYTEDRYSKMYKRVVETLLQELGKAGDYDSINNYASRALDIMPELIEAHFGLYKSACCTGSYESAQKQLQQAKENLTEGEYEKLIQYIESDKLCSFTLKNE